MTFDEPDGATPLDPDEMQGLKFSHVTTRGELDELEQANIEQGLAWISRRRGGSIFDDAFVRTLHKRLFGDVWAWGGEYRKTEKNIGIDPLHISVQLRTLLNDALLGGERCFSTSRSRCAFSSPHGTDSSIPERQWPSCAHRYRHLSRKHLQASARRLGQWL